VTVVGLRQLHSEIGAADSNLRRLREGAEQSFAGGADIVVFPELAVSGYTTDRATLQSVAEPIDGPAVTVLSSVANRHGGLVVFGFAERSHDRFFNTVVVVDGSGPILHYRKLHLFDREGEVYAEGDLGMPVVDTAYGRLGVCVCYDLRFVEVLRILSLQGADLVLAPAAWVAGFDPVVSAEGLTRQAEGVVTQANLNQVAVVAVSQVGPLGDTGTRLLGGSLAVDAYGDVIGAPLSRTEEDSTLVDIDLRAGREAQVRSALIRPREQRRRDVYSLNYGDNRW
jgi:predicted amidohydrolase